MARYLLDGCMPLTRPLRILLQRDGSLDEAAAAALWGAALDGALDELDLGAMVTALALTGATRDEAAGLLRAARERSVAWTPPRPARVVCLPAYGLAPDEALLVALLAALLPRFDLPVVVHGVLDSPCGASAARLLSELGVAPCATLQAAQAALAAQGVAFVPLQLFSPGLAALVALRARLGFINTAHLVAQSLDPTGDGVRIMLRADGLPCGRPDLLDLHAPGDSLALTWPPGAVPFHLQVRPRIERLGAGARELLFEADTPDPRAHVMAAPANGAARVRWIERVAQGALPVPAPALNLVAACLYAAGRAADFSRAKAGAAVQAGRLAA